MTAVAPCITLLTDFGTADGYAGAVKGVLSELCPAARLVDVTHEVAPGDIRAGAFALLTASRTFPAGTVHLAVVDPGVGTQRRGLLVEAAGSFYVGPDNGLLSLAAGSPRCVRVLDRPQWFRSPVSATFHARDVFAPIAARVAAGTEPAELGTAVSSMVEIEVPRPCRDRDGLCGEIFHVDRFGNLVTTIRASDLPSGHACLELQVGGRRLPFHATYGHAPKKTLIALIGSGGLVEVACVDGSAADALAEEGALGAPVRVVNPS